MCWNQRRRRRRQPLVGREEAVLPTGRYLISGLSGRVMTKWPAAMVSLLFACPSYMGVRIYGDRSAVPIRSQAIAERALHLLLIGRRERCEGRAKQ